MQLNALCVNHMQQWTPNDKSRKFEIDLIDELFYQIEFIVYWYLGECVGENLSTLMISYVCA